MVHSICRDSSKPRVAMTASPIYSTTALKEELELSKC
jgi:hypothetical protein